MQPIIFFLLSFLSSVAVCQQNAEFCSPEKVAGPPLQYHSITPYSFKIFRRLHHDMRAFTQGLVYYHGYLYESTGILGKSTVRKIDLASGAVLQESVLSDMFFGEGLLVYDNQIIQMSWKKGKIFYFDPVTLRHLKTRFWDKEVWGSSFIDDQLVISDGSSRLFFIDPVSLQVSRTIKVRIDEQEISGLNELEYVEGFIYANVWPTNCIVKIEPVQGDIVGWVNLSMLVPDQEHYHLPEQAVLNGIAYLQQNKHFIVTGKYWPFFYEIILFSDEK